MRSRYYNADGRPVDLFGRAQLQPFGFLSFAKAIPGFFDQFAPIPDEFWNKDADEDLSIAVVACPCGEEPSVGLNAMTECECERVFAFTGKGVRVANSPKGQTVNAGPAEPQEVDPEV